MLVVGKDVAHVSAFYEAVLGSRAVHGDGEHRVLQSPDVPRIVHAIPAPHASDVVVAGRAAAYAAGAVPHGPSPHLVYVGLEVAKALAVLALPIALGRSPRGSARLRTSSGAGRSQSRGFDRRLRTTNAVMRIDHAMAAAMPPSTERISARAWRGTEGSPQPGMPHAAE